MSKAAGRRKKKGFVAEQSKTALVLIDVINDLEFPEGKMLLKHAMPAARRIAALKAKATRRGIPTIYVNDNFGRWRSDFRAQVDRCLGIDIVGAEMVRLLVPNEADYFVLKPKHSGFHCTSLEILLKHIGAQTLILTGFAGNLCVLYTANDAYMRDFKLIVPRDCIASETRPANDYALSHMEECLRADIRPSTRQGFFTKL